LDPSLPPFGDPVRGDAVDTVCPLAADPSVRGTARVCSTIDPARPTNVKAAEGLDPAFAASVTATPEEIRHAHELRLQLEKKYLNRPDTSCFPWCVDVD